MAWQKIRKLRNKDIKINLYVIFIFLVLVLMSLFSAANLITVIELRKQVNLILNDTGTVSVGVTQNSQKPGVFTYHNVAGDPFFGAYYIDISKTDMRLDNIVTALTFFPIYDLNFEKECDTPFCGLLEQETPPPFSNDKLPSELKGKTITNINFSKLTDKWVIGIVTKEGSQEAGYAYLFDGNNLTPLITNATSQKINTQYNRGGGTISAGGSDDQFIIMYSGFEDIAYYYNRGSWQDLTQYFGLRVADGGFKARIIKGGSGNSANWYICSDNLDKPKLVKLWQNGTENIQGAVDLSANLGGSAAICSPKSDREINIARDLYNKHSLYSFKDLGFKNDNDYFYQSGNLSNYPDKKVISVYLYSYTINARPNSYSLAVSADGAKWQPYNGTEVNIGESDQNTFYIKGEFKKGNSEYSPWFGGLDIISYSAEDREVKK